MTPKHLTSGKMRKDRLTRVDQKNSHYRNMSVSPGTNLNAKRFAHKKNKGSHIKQLTRRFESALPILLSHASPRLNKIRQLILSGELVIIPIGFRCHTRRKIEGKYGPISEKTLPFDAGFFPPQSVASIIRSGKVNLGKQHGQDDYSICIKQEKQYEIDRGHGIVFSTSDYPDIDAAIETCSRKDRNKYLDSTFGYYTLNSKHNFVLAHYNWHRLACTADPNKSSDPAENIKNINRMLNRRLERMFHNCKKANWIIFVFAETQCYEFMKIDQQYFDLKDLSQILEAASSTLPQSAIFVKQWEDISSSKKLLSVIG